MQSINEIRAVYEKRISELEKLISELKENQLSREDKLKLAIFERAPFTIWACDKEYRIRLWTGKCEQIYGYAKCDVQGKAI